MKIYLSLALFLCRITNTPISYLLHPLDLIGGDQITQLAFFPGMNVKSDRKVEIFKIVVIKILKNFDFRNMTDYHVELSRNSKIKSVQLK
jgi:peptidoglycan-N-acetylglucosamine deacetylase